MLPIASSRWAEKIENRRRLTSLREGDRTGRTDRRSGGSFAKRRHKSTEDDLQEPGTGAAETVAAARCSTGVQGLQCMLCDFMYDESQGLPENGIRARNDAPMFPDN